MSDQDIKILAIGILWFFIGCVFGFLIGKTKFIKMEEEKNEMVITCILLGGFGNNLFIMMAAIAYSLKYKIKCYIPTKIKNPHYEGQKVFYSSKLNYKNHIISEVKGQIVFCTEKEFTYSEIPEYNCSLLVLEGYFQSYKFWGGYLPQLKKLLGLDCKMKHTYTVAVHIRRGDYLNLPSIHPVVTKEYIQEAVLRLMNVTGDFRWIFKFYSDDISWCKEANSGAFYDDSFQLEFSEGKTEEEDFRDMLGCRHFIISNSSFSLLAAILSESPDKVVIYPKTWFGENLKNDTKDLCPEDWISL